MLPQLLPVLACLERSSSPDCVVAGSATTSSKPPNSSCFHLLDPPVSQSSPGDIANWQVFSSLGQQPSLFTCWKSVLMIPCREGLVCTLSVVMCAMAFVYQGIWETISTNVAMFNHIWIEASDTLSTRGPSQEPVSTDQKMQIWCFKAKTRKGWIFLPGFVTNCVCPPCELNFALLTYIILFSGERYTPLTKLSVVSGLWKSRHPDSMAKDFCPVILHQASIFFQFWLFLLRSLLSGTERICAISAAAAK